MTEFINSFFTKNKTAFLTFLIFACVCGAVFRYDMAWWDFINYHYYNAWAFLNDRLNVDIIPAFANTFFSPFIELPSYFLANALNDHSAVFSAVMAVPYGLLLFIVYKIAALFFSSDTTEGRSRIGLTLLLCVCSTPVFSEISGTTHEHIQSFFVLSALYLLLKGLKEHILSVKSVVFSGFILGAAAGLKLTYASFAAATGIALIVFYKQYKNPFKTIAFFTLAGVVGFLVSYGYWGWILWKNFQNPFFPFFNSVFHSPYWEGPDYGDTRYFDLSWLNVLFYPFYTVFKVKGDFTLHRFLISHLRLIVGVFVFIAVFISVVKKHIKRVKETDNDFLLHFLMFWMFVVYVFWLCLFRIYRYMFPFEMMLSVVLVYFFFKEQKTENFSRFITSTFISAFIIAVFLECVSIPFSRPYDKKVIDVDSAVTLPENSLVLIKEAPGALFIPFFARNSSIRAAVSPVLTDAVNGSDFHATGYFAGKRNQLLNEYKKENIFYITRYEWDPPCFVFGSFRISEDNYHICPYIKEMKK